MPTKKISLLEKVHIPEKISTTIGLVGLVLLLTMLFPNKDFGIIKTPDISNNVWWISPLGLLLIIANIPFLKSKENIESTDVTIFKESRELHEQFKDIIGSAQKEIIFWEAIFIFRLMKTGSRFWKD